MTSVSFVFCQQVFAGFSSLLVHKEKVHRAQSLQKTKKVDMTQSAKVFGTENLKEELEMCQHFLLDSDLENGRQRVFYFSMGLLEIHTLSQKLSTVSEKLKRAAKFTVAFDFLVKK